MHVPDRQRWSSELKQIVALEFDGNAGPTKVLAAVKKEVDFFDLIFPSDLYHIYAEQMNLYAWQKQAQNVNDPKWMETSEEEIGVYMSTVDLPDIKLYRSKDEFYGNFIVGEVLPGDRFEKISQYFYVSDATGYDRNDPCHDKLHLICPIIDHVNAECVAACNPHREVTVDKAMVAFCGRLSFRRYLPAKPTKYSIKVWVRADSTNGFANEFQVCVG